MSEKIDTKNHPTVKALSQHQDRLGETDAAFARRYIGCSAATWSLLRSGQYMAKDPSAMLERCDAALQILNDQFEQAGDNVNKGKILDLAHVRAALQAVKRCYGEPQNRLVVYLAQSGGGKTTLARKLSEIYLSAVVRVEASETWRGSYFAAVVGVLEALGIDETFPSVRLAEQRALDALAATPRILVIDEGHYLGPQALNFLKAVLNKTASRVVLLAIPQLWQRMQQKAYEEAQQLRRRTHAKITVPDVTPTDCRTFLAAKLPGYATLNGDEKAAVEACRMSANAFGYFDTLERICEEIAEENDGHALTLDTVKAAIRRVEALRS